MSIFLFNEAIGSALVGAVIPSIYSSLMLGGVYLLKISLLAMLLPYCLLIGVPFYITFVYRSSIIAYAKRVAERKRAAKEGVTHTVSTRLRSRSKNSGNSQSDKESHVLSKDRCVGYIMRIGRNSTYALQSIVAFFSHHHLVERRAHEQLIRVTWRSMNMPQTAQGSVPVLLPRSCNSSGSRLQPGPRTLLKKMNSFKTSKFTPVLVACEEASTPALESMSIEVDDGDVDKTADTDIHAMLGTQLDMLGAPEGVVAVESRLNSLIIFETEEALSMMRRKLNLNNGGRGSRTALTDVVAADLMEEFKEVLEIFYPDGVAMTEVEKEEACKLFGLWRDKQNTRNNVSFVDDDPPMANFPQFESWFSVNLIRTMHSVKTERDKEVERQRLEAEARRKTTKKIAVGEVRSPLSGLFPHEGKAAAPSRINPLVIEPLTFLPEGIRSNSKEQSQSQNPSPTSLRTAKSNRVWPESDLEP